MDKRRNDELMTDDKSQIAAKQRLVVSCFDIRALSFSSGVSQHFLDGGVAGKDAAQAVLSQCYHSKLHSLLL